MSNVPVQKATDEKSLPVRWFDELQKFSDQVRRKAFELFEGHGRPDGHDVDDWLEAEKQLLTVPRTELVETADGLEAHITVPGFDAKEIEVTALPDSLLVRAESSREREKKEGEVRYSEFSDQSLFRRIPLPQPIDVAAVTAKLEKGILNIAARKAAAKEKETERKITVAAA